MYLRICTAACDSKRECARQVVGVRVEVNLRPEEVHLEEMMRLIAILLRGDDPSLHMRGSAYTKCDLLLAFGALRARSCCFPIRRFPVRRFICTRLREDIRPKMYAML